MADCTDTRNECMGGTRGSCVRGACGVCGTCGALDERSW